LGIGDVYGNSGLKEPGETRRGVSSSSQEKHGGNLRKAKKWVVFERLFKHNETYQVFQNKMGYFEKSSFIKKKKA
jgi:hypothetical protein